MLGLVFLCLILLGFWLYQSQEQETKTTPNFISTQQSHINQAIAKRRLVESRKKQRSLKRKTEH